MNNNANFGETSSIIDFEVLTDPKELKRLNQDLAQTQTCLAETQNKLKLLEAELEQERIQKDARTKLSDSQLLEASQTIKELKHFIEVSVQERENKNREVGILVNHLETEKQNLLEKLQETQGVITNQEQNQQSREDEKYLAAVKEKERVAVINEELWREIQGYKQEIAENNEQLNEYQEKNQNLQEVIKELTIKNEDQEQKYECVTDVEEMKQQLVKQFEEEKKVIEIENAGLRQQCKELLEKLKGYKEEFEEKMKIQEEKTNLHQAQIQLSQQTVYKEMDFTTLLTDTILPQIESSIIEGPDKHDQRKVLTQKTFIAILDQLKAVCYQRQLLLAFTLKQ